ncbi:peroxiredoxin family protein [Xylanivirga thermophila]|uniref:peroxiredoxin family protein n=1 Tax=Xylanivirga thermophila TaxID=2496273 RepID=UPI0013EAF08A|nr:TlpA disulfide reductase family protein [Xylanivirga thermophila]
MKKHTKFFIMLMIIVVMMGLIACTSGKKDNRDKDMELDQQDNDNKDTADLLEGYDYLVIDEPIEDFELKDLEGNIVKLSDYNGKVVFLNFWATWCPPCKAEMPHMQELHHEYVDKDAAVLAISSTNIELKGGDDVKRAKGGVSKFIERQKYTFPVLLDEDSHIAQRYNQIYPLSGIPTTFIIDKEGTIRYVRVGPFIDKKQMEAFIKLAQE